MANSSDTSAGADGLATQYNNLRADVLNITTGHIHSGSADEGKKLPHLIPPTDSTGDLGSSALRWNNLYVITVTQGDCNFTDLMCPKCHKKFKKGDMLGLYVKGLKKIKDKKSKKKLTVVVTIPAHQKCKGEK